LREAGEMMERRGTPVGKGRDGSGNFDFRLGKGYMYSGLIGTMTTNKEMDVIFLL
jgi:hypothetical protein